jgi:hypothetical protein
LKFNRAYFFDYITVATDFILDGLPNYASATITVTFSNPGQTAACGTFQMGRAIEIGGTKPGYRVGIVSFSGVEDDGFGGKKITKRGFAKRGSYEVTVHEALASPVSNLLAEYDAVPTVFIGDESEPFTLMYALLKDWEMSVQQGPKALSMSVESLA